MEDGEHAWPMMMRPILQTGRGKVYKLYENTDNYRESKSCCGPWIWEQDCYSVGSVEVEGFPRTVDRSRNLAPVRSLSTRRNLGRSVEGRERYGELLYADWLQSRSRLGSTTYPSASASSAKPHCAIR